jgi:outer membrane lipoprotein-sorting protein
MSKTLTSAALVLALAGAGSAGETAKDNLETWSPKAKGALERLTRGLGKLRSLEETAEFRMDSDVGNMGASDGQKLSFSYLTPNRFRFLLPQTEVVCDGKELTVLKKDINRYTTQKLDPKQDVVGQITRHMGPFSLEISNGLLVVSKDPRDRIARAFRHMDVTGRETRHGDACLVLQGIAGVPGSWIKGEVPVTVWMRETDGLIRGIEFDLLQLAQESAEHFQNATYFNMLYDVTDLTVNERPDAKTFSFTPPDGVKKTDRIYSRWGHSGEGAQQYVLSGKPVPEFEGKTLAGDVVGSDRLAGKVGVVSFLFSGGGHTSPGVEELQALYAKHRDRGLEVIVVVQGDPDNDKLSETFDAAGAAYPVIYERGSAIARQLECQRGGATVLINRDGIVQGRYGGFLTRELANAVAKDVEKLLDGKQLASAKPMTEAEVEEYEEQTTPRYTRPSQVEPLNEKWLRETWSVRASNEGGRYWSSGAGPQADEEGIWVRHRDRIRKINLQGETLAEVPVPPIKAAGEGYMPPTPFLAGAVGRGGRPGVITVETIVDEETEERYQPPVGVIFAAHDGQGTQRWRLEVRGEKHQQPQHLTLANLDGRPGDELIFTYSNAIHVISNEGELVVRKPGRNWPQWILVQDKDGDGRAEIYLRDGLHLRRYDFRPQDRPGE